MTAIGLFAVWANYKIHCIPIPQYEKLADFTSKSLAFPMTVRFHDPYHLVLSVSHSSTGPLSFRGEVEIRQRTQLVARIQISSDDVEPCNWLDQMPGPGLAGYILRWSRTNPGERLDELLANGQSYDVTVSFSHQPPRDCSLWLASMGRVGEP